MKTFSFTSTLYSLTFLFMFTSIAVYSQKTNTWKGGTPGQETEWNCPKNWSAYSVPDEFTDVLIPDVSTTTLANPVLRYGSFEINSLFLESDARLTIKEDARLLVYVSAIGITDYNLEQNGPLIIINEDGDQHSGSVAVHGPKK